MLTVVCILEIVVSVASLGLSLRSMGGRSSKALVSVQEGACWAVWVSAVKMGEEHMGSEVPDLPSSLTVGWECEPISCPSWLLLPHVFLWLPSGSFPTLSKSVPHFSYSAPHLSCWRAPPCCLSLSVPSSAGFKLWKPPRLSLISSSYYLFRMKKRQRRSFLVEIRHLPPQPKRRSLLSCDLPKPTCVPVLSNPGRT